MVKCLPKKLTKHFQVMVLVDTANGSVEFIHGVRSRKYHVIAGIACTRKLTAGTSEVRHYHQRSRQFFFVLSGQATIEIAGTRQVLCEHEGVEVPSGVPHQMLNESEQDLEFLVIFQPPSHGDRILMT